MLTPAQLAELRAHLRPLKYTLPFALLVATTGIIFLIFLRSPVSRFLLVGMVVCLGLVYVTVFLGWLRRDLCLRFLHANQRGRVRLRRTRLPDDGILPDDIGE